jgi:glucosamine 6-phosphate synthetase-like amidotransferase/phosphosugar isomerase protein
VFSVETDTEMIAHLIEHGARPRPDLLAAVRSAVARCAAPMPSAVLDEASPGELIIARHAGRP